MGNAHAFIYGSQIPGGEVVIDATFWPNVPAETNSGLVGLTRPNAGSFLESLLFNVASERKEVLIIPVIDKSVPAKIAEKIAVGLGMINRYAKDKGWERSSYCINFSQN